MFDLGDFFNTIIRHPLLSIFTGIVCFYLGHRFGIFRDRKNRKIKVFDNARDFFLDERKKITHTQAGQDFYGQERIIGNVERFSNNTCLRDMWKEYKQTEKSNRTVKQYPDHPVVDYTDKDNVLHNIDRIIEFLNIK